MCEPQPAKGRFSFLPTPMDLEGNMVEPVFISKRFSRDQLDKFPIGAAGLGGGGINRIG